MPKLEVEGVGAFEVSENKRLVLAIEEDAGVDILHRCGSYARCTTCRIEYIEGEPEKMTKAELEVLKSRNLLGQVRLSCQTLADRDKKVRVSMTVTSTGLDGPGPHPGLTSPPHPSGWISRPEAHLFLRGPRDSSKGLNPPTRSTDGALSKKVLVSRKRGVRTGHRKDWAISAKFAGTEF